VRDELLDVEEFSCLAETVVIAEAVVIADWRKDYNHRRPQSSVGMRSPAAYAAAHTECCRAAQTAAGERDGALDGLDRAPVTIGSVQPGPGKAESG
jgi:Integrase core domain